MHKVGNDYFLVTIPNNSNPLKWGDWYYDNHGRIIQWTEEWQIKNKLSNDTKYTQPKVVASTQNLEGVTKIFINDITNFQLSV